MIEEFNSIATTYALKPIDTKKIIQVHGESESHPISVWLKYNAALHNEPHNGTNEDGYRWKQIYVGSQPINYKPF